jgi:hypothetical protein
MRKTIAVSINTAYGTATLLPGLAPVATWDCEVLQALLLVGYLTTPPRYRGISLSTYWAWLRYGAAVSTSQHWLSLRPVWDELDPHQKTILADDFGLGFPCHFLAEQHGFEDFADTGYLLETLFPGIVSHAARAKRGPSKTPDLIAVDSSDRLHVLECKGTQTSRDYLDRAMARGIDQKNNLSNGTIFTSSMVGGLFIPQARNSEHAQLVFIDPRPDAALAALQNLAPKMIVRAVRRQSFAKALGMAGLWSAARVVATGSVVQSEAAFVSDLESGELRFNGFAKVDGDVWRKTVEYRSLETERKDDADRAAYLTRLEIDVPNEVVMFLKQLTSSGPKRINETLDVWIEERLAKNRTVRARPLRVQNQQNRRYVTRRRNVLSGVDMSILEGLIETANLTVSSGLTFRIMREKFA